MARFVVDANVVIGLVGLHLEDNPRVREFWSELTEEDELIGPRMLIPECTSAIRTKVFDRRISHREGERWLEAIFQLPIGVYDDADQFRKAYDLARRMGHRKAYDMQYLAIAQLEDCELVTIDSGLRQAAINFKHPVRFLR